VTWVICDTSQVYPSKGLYAVEFGSVGAGGGGGFGGGGGRGGGRGGGWGGGGGGGGVLLVWRVWMEGVTFLTPFLAPPFTTSGLLQCVAVCCNVWGCYVLDALSSSSLYNFRKVAVCCSVLKCEQWLQCITVCEDVTFSTPSLAYLISTPSLDPSFTTSNVSQCVAVCCSV